jgi:hypothetical protein
MTIYKESYRKIIVLPITGLHRKTGTKAPNRD